MYIWYIFLVTVGREKDGAEKTYSKNTEIIPNLKTILEAL